MTEYELVNTAGVAYGNGVNAFALFITIVTAYSVIAYTTGAKLTRSQ